MNPEEISIETMHFLELVECYESDIEITGSINNLVIGFPYLTNLLYSLDYPAIEDLKSRVLPMKKCQGITSV